MKRSSSFCASSVKRNLPRTGWPPSLLMQDDCKGLSQWFASKPDARRIVREVGAQIAEDRFNSIGLCPVERHVRGERR
jgi:hypothetical protein